MEVKDFEVNILSRFARAKNNMQRCKLHPPLQLALIEDKENGVQHNCRSRYAQILQKGVLNCLNSAYHSLVEHGHMLRLVKILPHG